MRLKSREPRYLGAVDQGTSSTRFIVFDRAGRVVSSAQKEHRQIYPKPGWVEHSPAEIWRRTQEVVAAAMRRKGLKPRDLAAVGIANQRETTVVWSRKTGRAVGNAIVWQDTRVQKDAAELAKDGGLDRLRAKTGLPLSTYFSGLKLRWILEHVPGARARAEAGELLFGTVDSFLLWNLTGGPKGGVHATDATNASRTQLLNLKTLAWDRDILKLFAIPEKILPEPRSSAEIYGRARLPAIEGVPIAGILGDQQAALFGQACFNRGEAKSTYGTGCFLLMNTGTAPVASSSGLVTTVACKLGKSPALYALEGSVAVGGALVQWLRDNLGLIRRSSDVEALARTVEDNGGVYFVPAFSGLYAPYWNAGARGVVAGLTRYANKGHLARAALEATAYQIREVVEAMEADSGVRLDSLRADGGMAANATLMQFQADILNRPVVRPTVLETTALGAACAAGLAAGFFRDLDELRSNWRAGRSWEPRMPESERSDLYRCWKKAVTRSFNWVE
ncbi:MAG: glycerol kinase GlpK [Elusimicrobia bacterium]|nr:glycerol kinase GlpK [Elusimicrobiota bacterium]